MFVKGVLLTLLISQISCSISESVLKRALITPAVSSCDPQMACDELNQAGVLVADPKDCHNYYVCVTIEGDIQPSDNPLTCPEGQFFDTDVLACVEETRPCSTSCENSCSLVCTAPLQVVGDPRNCNIYYICLLGGEQLPEDCPPDKPYFDGGNCTTDPSSCCDFCTPSCPGVGLQVADPCDCTKYYICLTAGTPTEDTHTQCSSGQYFDHEKGTCVVGVGCDPLCLCGQTTLPGGSTTTTTTTTSTASPPTTTTEGNGSGCSNSLQCSAVGDFPRCSGCDSSYFHCNSVGSTAEIRTCPSGTVFNPTPDYPYCVLPSQCPRN